MASAKKIYLEYKYVNEPWKTYDWTTVAAWADTQMARMIREFPNAEYRRIKR